MKRNNVTENQQQNGGCLFTLSTNVVIYCRISIIPETGDTTDHKTDLVPALRRKDNEQTVILLSNIEVFINFYFVRNIL